MKDFYNDNDVKFEYNPDSNKYSFDRQIVGATAGETLTLKDYTDTDANTIYVNGSTGSDSNAGTAAAPKVTILAAINACTSTKTKVIVANSQTFVESVSAYSNAYFEQIFADTAITAILDRRLLGFTPADANSIFFNSTTGTTGGTGAAADPYSTIAEAVAAVDATHQAIVCQGSETYEEPGIEFTGNFLGMYAAQGQTPTFNPTVNTALDSYSDIEEVLAATNFTSGGADFSSASFSDGSFVICYRVSTAGKFVIYNSDGSVKVAETSFGAAAVSVTAGIACAVLSNDNFVVCYQTTSIGRFTIFNSSGVTQVSETTFSSSAAADISCAVFSDDEFVICYDIGAGTFVIFNSIGVEQVAAVTFEAGSSTYTSCAVFSDNEFVICYDDLGDASKGKFCVYDQAGANQVASTEFEAGNTNHIACAVFSDNEFVICYQDAGDANKGKFCIYDQNGANQVASTEFSSSASIIGCVILDNDDFFIKYNKVNSEFIIYNQAGNNVVAETEFYGASSTEQSINLLQNNSVVLCYSSSFVIWYPYSFSGIKISAASTINGWILDSNEEGGLKKLIELNSAKITLKNCNLINTTNLGNSEYVAGTVINYAIYGDDELDIDNCIIGDNGAGIYTADNDVNIQECSIYRNNMSTSAVSDYAIHIDGTGSGIVIEHNTIFNNYGAIRLENNNGSTEVLKNLIIHGNDQYGINADTAQDYSYSINTDSNNNATAGTNVILANPLFINEGAYVPANIDLELKMRVLGYSSDSPANLLGDDSRDVGCFWVARIGSITTWTSFTIEKPPEIKVYHKAVGAVKNERRDGSISTSREAYTEYVEFNFPALLTADYDYILALFIADTNTVRIYPDPTTNSTDYDVYILEYKKSLSASAVHFRLTETGIANLTLVFGRAYS